LNEMVPLQDTTGAEGGVELIATAVGEVSNARLTWIVSELATPTGANVMFRVKEIGVGVGVCAQPAAAKIDKQRTK